MMRSLLQLRNITGKVVLLRVDFNVENASDALRLERSLPTLRHLHRLGAIVLIMSHRGRPGGRVVPELSLKFSLPFLRERLASRHVGFFPTLDPAHIKKELALAKPGDVFVLENVRFYGGEEAQSLAERLAFAKKLAALGDLYVNDAFAVCHHPGASLTELPTLLPAYPGLLLRRETEHLDRILHHPKKPLIVVLAGGKAADKLAMLKNLHSRADLFLVGGVLANTFLYIRGERMLASSIDHDILHEAREHAKDPKIMLPVDFSKNTHGCVLDIGPKTVAQFAEAINGAKTVVWNGPMGRFEDPRYRAGTLGVARAIAHARAFSVVGGGETTQFILEEHLDTKFGFLSTGGGAMLAYLAGKKLPGIEALKH